MLCNYLSVNKSQVLKTVNMHQAKYTKLAHFKMQNITLCLFALKKYNQISNRYINAFRSSNNGFPYFQNFLSTLFRIQLICI